MNALQTTLKQLRLSGLSQKLDVRIQEAAADHLSHSEFLELICQDELYVRQQRLMERHTKLADFRHLKTLDDFDWSFNPSVHKKEIFDLASCRFIREAKDLLFLGPPGVGKTHLTQAIGYEAIRQNFLVLYRSIFDLVRDFMKDEAFNQQDKTLRRYLKPDLVIIDDMGLKQLPKHSRWCIRRPARQQRGLIFNCCPSRRPERLKARRQPEPASSPARSFLPVSPNPGQPP